MHQEEHDRKTLIDAARQGLAKVDFRELALRAEVSERTARRVFARHPDVSAASIDRVVRVLRGERPR